jgi:hypothetical protein
MRGLAQFRAVPPIHDRKATIRTDVIGLWGGKKVGKRLKDTNM